MAGPLSETGSSPGSFICVEATVDDLRCADRCGAIAEMIDAAAACGEFPLDQRESILEACLARERLGSTAIGLGVAIPHTKHPAMTKSVVVVGRSRTGIDFGSIDGEPVHAVFLLLGSPDAPGELLVALEGLMHMLRDGELCCRLCGAVDRDEILDIIRPIVCG